MQISEILIPAAIFAGMGIVFGVVLAIAAKIFEVKTDERVAAITELLPGANCGGCGMSGCSAMAEAIVSGKALPTACNSCSEENMKQIGAIMGMEVGEKIPLQAKVMCSGACGVAVKQYRYEGAEDCLAAERMGGGDKVCPNGCIGLGTCVSVCKFDAIHVINGVAVVDPSKCSGCGACTNICPKHIINLIPVKSKYYVACKSVENGAKTRKQCAAGCISCKICEKNCPVGAITVNDFVASIDQSKCISCGKCAEKCPRKIIHRDDKMPSELLEK